MTKFKLRKIAVAGVMALGIAAIVPAVNASADNTEITDITYESENDILLISDSGDPVFYTDTKNAKTKLPSADKWVRAEKGNNGWEIDLSSYSKETVIYIANSTSANSDDILAVTIPAKSTLNVKLTNAILPTSGAFTFTTTSVTTKKGNKDGAYSYDSKKDAGVGEILSRLEVKKSTAANWETIDDFFNNCTLSQLQSKGTTLQFRLAAIDRTIVAMTSEELVASKAIATTGAITSEMPRYKIEGSKITTGEVSSRASDMATVKIAKKANAPVVAIDYDYFTATIKKGSNYTKLQEGEFKGQNTLTSTWIEASDKVTVPLTQGATNYIAVKTKEDTGKKKPESNIAYLALGEQPEFATSNSEADANTDLVIVSSTFDSTGKVKGAELYIKGMQGETYQYCFGKASDILNGDKTQFVADKTKVKWSKLVNNAAKNKAPEIAAKTATIKNLGEADTILVRKASNKNKGQFASEYIIFTKDGNGWKKSEQDKTVAEVSQIVISTPSAVTYDANEITCELPISVASATVTGKIEAKCGKNTVTGSAVASNNKLTVTIPRKANSGLEKENDKLTFTLTIEAGAVSGNGSLASNKSVNTITIDTKKPKVIGAKASVSAKKITITLSEAIEMDNGAVSAVTVSGKAINGFTPALATSKKVIDITGVTFAKGDEVKVELDFTKIKDVSKQKNQASYDTSKVTVDSTSSSAIVFKAVAK